MAAIDLNADLGEGMGTDEAMMPCLTSCSIACGGHAGDEASMRAVLRLAARRGVAAGAHPSYPDRSGFGRRRLGLAPDTLREAVTGQVEHLAELAASEGVTLRHLKPHGALYHAAAGDEEVAAMLAAVAAAHGLALVGPPGSEVAEAAARADLVYLREGFADRAYEADGSLRPRGQPGAVLSTDEARAAQAVRLAGGPFETICLHGDSEGAAASAAAVRAALEAAGHDVRAALG